MNNFVIKFCTTQVHLLGVRQVNNWYAIKIYEKLIAQSPNEFKYPKKYKLMSMGGMGENAHGTVFIIDRHWKPSQFLPRGDKL